MDDAASPATAQSHFKNLPSMDLPTSDLMRSTRGQNLNAMLRNPGTRDWADETPRRMAVERAVLSVREKSSYGLRESFAVEEPPPPTNAAGRPTTRTHLMAMRREEQRTENTKIGASNPRLSLPVGNQPGAPGKNPEYKRFTHHDVDRLRPGR